MANDVIDPKRVEQLGPAEKIIDTVTRFTDHLVHNRPGFVVPKRDAAIGVSWTQATWRLQEDGTKKVFVLTKEGKKTVEKEVGVLGADYKVQAAGRVVGEFRDPGLFPEVAVYLYRQIANVFKMDNEFAAKWASWAFGQDRRDLKTILAAFMLVQNRRGDPVMDDGKVLFADEDYRAVGEAMFLLMHKDALNPRQVKLIGEILRLPGIMAINRELGFAQSAKNPQMHRYVKGVHKWLAHREANPKLLKGLVKAGFSRTVRELAQATHYKPATEAFYATLRWKQKQASLGHRKIGLAMELVQAATWEGKTEAEICQEIVDNKMKWKVIAGRIPSSIGLTRAIVAATVQAGGLSDRDLIILTPTLEELGLLSVEPVASAWKAACQTANDQRAANVARNVKDEKVQEALQGAADVAAAKAMEKVTKDLRIYVFIDKSSSMNHAIEAAKRCLSKFVGAFPLDRCHVAVFNTVGTELKIQAARSVAVEQAFRGHMASGGTAYFEGVRALQHHKPKDTEDTLFIFAGDQEGEMPNDLAKVVTASGLRPSAFAMLMFGTNGRTVQDAAAILKIPFFKIEESLFDDPYAVTQTLSHLIASTPVGVNRPATAPVAPRVTLVETILKTPLLQKPLGF